MLQPTMHWLILVWFDGGFGSVGTIDGLVRPFAQVAPLAYQLAVFLGTTALHVAALGLTPAVIPSACIIVVVTFVFAAATLMSIGHPFALWPMREQREQRGGKGFEFRPFPRPASIA